jgi:poly-gamma-glutamate synthesis protein (capsule biosynthesis protein)
MANLLIGGDFYISDDCRGKDLFEIAVINLFANADYRIVNLEAPITINNRKNKILKTGDHLQSSKGTTIPYLKKLKIDLVTLANNHIMDYGQSGLLDTLSSLESAQIDFVGCGLNLQDAGKPFVLTKEGMRIAILNFTHNEWANASLERPGANPLDWIENFQQIREAKKDNDVVIIIIHAGHEYFHFPSPKLKRLYRAYAECGASLIAGHHSHCISGFEVYKGIPLFYGLGNFIFTEHSQFGSWYTGLILNLQIQKNRGLQWELIPVCQSKRDYSLALLEGREKDLINNSVKQYGETIADEELLIKEWESLLLDRGRGYLNVFNPLNFIQNRYIRSALIKLGIDRFFIRKKHYAQILNHLRCETHFEASKDVIEQYLK